MLGAKSFGFTAECCPHEGQLGPSIHLSLSLNHTFV